MKKLNNLNCQNLSFDSKLSTERMEKAKSIFGEKILINILCLCFYLMGMKRVSIASAFDISENTIRAKVRTFFRDGFYSLGDRREKNQNQPLKNLPRENPGSGKDTVKKTPEEIVITLGDISFTLPTNNDLQVKTSNSNYDFFRQDLQDKQDEMSGSC